jgi:hypothetical protein
LRVAARSAGRADFFEPRQRADPHFSDQGRIAAPNRRELFCDKGLTRR